MPADFPQSPAVNDTFVATNGATYTWDGVKWVNTGCPAGGGGSLDNLLAGTCITLPKTGDNVTVNASIPCIQTPWLQNVNAGGFQLVNASGVQTPLVAAPPSNTLTLTGSGSVQIGVDSSQPVLIGSNAVNINWTATLNATAATQNPDLKFTNSLGNSWDFQEDAGSVTTNALRLRYNVTNEWMTWLPNGNVGIHTATPQTMLDVQGIAPNGQIQFGNGTGRAALYCDALNGGIGTVSNIPLIFWTNNGSPQMILHQNGAVGIGTVGAFTGALYVAGNSFFNGIETVFPQTNPTDAINGIPLVIRESTNNSAYGLYLGLVGPDWHGSIQAVQANAATTLALNPQGGYVGIATKAPQSPLHVVGPNIGLCLSNDDSASNYFIYRYNPDGNLYFQGNQDAFSGFIFRTTHSGTSLNAVAINNNGNVGIGLVGASNTLTVNNGSLFNPNANAQSAILVQSAYGGGYLMVDGGIYMGMWSVNGDLQFRTGGSSSGFGTPIGQMTISHTTGNVGINQGSPGTTLDVGGSIRSNAYIGQSPTHYAATIAAQEEQPVSGSAQSNGTVLFNFQSPQTQMQLQYRRSNGQLYYVTLQMTLIAG